MAGKTATLKDFNSMNCQCRYCNKVVALSGHDCSAKFAAKNKIVWHGKVRNYGKWKRRRKIDVV